jgi:AcrR family transcriptional regulator
MAPYCTSEQTQIRKNARRKHIINTAIKIFAANGYHGTTVKNIVDEAETSVGNFYFYFKNKEDIFETLYEEMHFMVGHFIQSMIEGSTYKIVEKFCRGAASSLWVYQQYRDISRILLLEGISLNPRFEKKRVALIASSAEAKVTLFNHLKEKNLIKVPDVRLAAIAIDGGYFNVITSWLQSETPWDLTTAAYPLAVFNLQALGISFEEEEALHHVAICLEECPTSFETFRNQTLL